MCGERVVEGGCSGTTEVVKAFSQIVSDSKLWESSSRDRIKELQCSLRQQVRRSLQHNLPQSDQDNVSPSCSGFHENTECSEILVQRGWGCVWAGGGIFDKSANCLLLLCCYMTRHLFHLGGILLFESTVVPGVHRGSAVSCRYIKVSWNLCCGCRQSAALGSAALRPLHLRQGKLLIERLS